MKTWAWLWLLWAAVGEGASLPSGAVDLPPMDFPHRVVLDHENTYVMMWTPLDAEIVIEVQVATRGYVGLGFSPTGRMKGADIVLGWVANGKVFLHDRYAGGYRMPTVDASQDVTLRGGYENDTHTVLRFSRPWDSCDAAQHDMVLSEDTVRVIWAYSYQDPTSETIMARHNKRGTKSLYLKQAQFTLPSFTPDVQTWDLLAGNLSLPDTLSTLYWCKMFKIPLLARKNHMIGFLPVVEAKNVDHMHHVLLYECHLSDSERHLEKWVDDPGTQCFHSNMPSSWYHCRNVVLAWAVGGQGEMFPDHVGFPMGEEHGGATYYMLQIHFDNPNLLPGIVDNSGIRVFHTEKLRQHDAGNMEMGHAVSPNQVVPPRQAEWLTVGVCHESCTRLHLPREGIKIFQGVLHSHNIGSSLTLRHIRGGQELPLLLQDRTYDFNYQQMRKLKEERTVLPGDTFIAECVYDSTSRRNPTFGGLGTEEEMCLAFVSYYPRGKFGTCMSKTPFEAVVAALGIHDAEKRLPSSRKKTQTVSTTTTRWDEKEKKLSFAFKYVIAKAPQKFANRTVYDILHDEATWADGSVAEALRKVMQKGERKVVCKTQGNHKGDRLNATTYPAFTPLKPQVPVCKVGPV